MSPINICEKQNNVFYTHTAGYLASVISLDDMYFYVIQKTQYITLVIELVALVSALLVCGILYVIFRFTIMFSESVIIPIDRLIDSF